FLTRRFQKLPSGAVRVMPAHAGAVLADLLVGHCRFGLGRGPGPGRERPWDVDPEVIADAVLYSLAAGHVSPRVSPIRPRLTDLYGLCRRGRRVGARARFRYDLRDR